MKKINMNELTTDAEHEVDKVKRKAKRAARSWKAKLIAWLIVILLILVALFGAFYTASKWYRSHDVFFRSPFQSPIIIKSRIQEIKVIKVVVTPMPTPDLKTEKTEKELILAQKHGEELWKIYQLETQRGKTDNCRATGEGFAGFGVMFDDKVVCYPTFEKAVERAEYWFASFKPEVNLVDALCTWNLGHNVDPVSLKVVNHMNCGYYQKYLAVNN